MSELRSFSLARFPTPYGEGERPINAFVFPRAVQSKSPQESELNFSPGYFLGYWQRKFLMQLSGTEALHSEGERQHESVK